MKTHIQIAPIRLGHSLVVGSQKLARLSYVRGRHIRNCQLQRATLQRQAHVEHFDVITDSKCCNGCSSVWGQYHQSLGFQAGERFTDRYFADADYSGDFILANGSTFGECSVGDTPLDFFISFSRGCDCLLRWLHAHGYLNLTAWLCFYDHESIPNLDF